MSQLIVHQRPDQRGRASASGAAASDPAKQEAAQQVEQISRLMDGLFRVPGLGWRFGLDPLLGLIPGLGDTVSSVVSLYTLVLAARCGLPKIMLVRMGLNVGADFLIGSIPLLGDVFDFFWKSNQRNLELLRTRLDREPNRRGTASDWLVVGLLVLVLLGLLIGAVALAWWSIDYLMGLWTSWTR